MENNEPVKIIHYCWFGPRKLSKVAKKCIKTWKKFLPDYEIKLWTESNFDFNQNEFVRQAYENKKWAFVADYARLKALSEFGGIYFDTKVNAAVLGAKRPHEKFIDDMIAVYDSLEKFDKENIYSITIPALITKELEKYGFDENKKEIQYFFNGDVVVYPRDYFYPLSYDYQDNLFSENTCMKHLYDATWASTPEKITLFFRRHNMKFMVGIVFSCVNVKNRIKKFFKGGKEDK